MPGSTIFTPPLSTHTIITVPRSSSPTKVVINFKALPPSSSSLPLRTDLPIPQLWTNLGSASSEWRAIPFLPLDVDSSPPSQDAANWPILSLSNESPPLLPSLRARFATLSFDVDESFLGNEYGYTYRLQHPDQGIEWLGSDGSNGSFKFELQEGGGGDGETVGRWRKEGEPSEEVTEGGKRNKIIRWNGGEGEVGIKIGEGWEGFGVSFDERNIPSAHLLSSPTPLSTILLQPTPSNPPIHHVGLPSTPIILSADPSSYFLTSGSAIKLKHSVDGFAPKAAFYSLPSTNASSISPSLPAGLEYLPSSGETTALLSSKTKSIFLHSTTTTSPFPISIELSKASSSFAGGKSDSSLAVYSESGGAVVQLDEGVGGVLVDRLDGSLSTLKIVELSRVAGSDLFVGTLNPPFSSHPQVQDIPVTKPISSVVENNSETTSEPSEEVNGAHEVEDQEESSEEERGHARVLGGGAEIERRGGFAAFLRWWATLWQAVLSLFGVARKEAKTVKFDDETEAIPTASTETTPLLTHNHSHTSTAPSASSTLSSPANTTSPLPLNPTLFVPSGLQGGLLISSPSSSETPNLVLKARLASSSNGGWTDLQWKGELESVSNSQGGNWFKGVVVGGKELLGKGEEDWALWVGEGKKEDGKTVA